MQRLSQTALIFTLLALFYSAGAAQAQPTGEIRGIVRDARTGEPLPGANIQIENTYRGTSTDRDGAFRLARLAPGAYVLRVTFIGYAAARLPVRVAAGEPRVQQIRLQPGAIQMGEIVVTASKQSEEIERATTSVSVLTDRAAMRRNALRLDAVLESIPGVNLMAENVNIRNSTGYTRGLGSRILMLLDGVPIIMSDFGNMNWDIVPVTDIERVEVVKGPASAIYGSFALGGVMNILTKSPAPRGRLAVRTTAGIYDRPYYDSWKWTDRLLNFNRTDISYSRQFGALGVKASVGRHESTGDRMNRHFQRWNVSSKLIWTPNNRTELSAYGSYASDRRGEFVWARLDQPYRVEPEMEDFRVRLDAFSFYLKYRQKLSERTELGARASYLRQLAGNQFRVEGDFKPAQGPGANVELSTELAPTYHLTTGLEYKYDFAEQRHFGRHFAYTLSPFAHNVWEPLPRLRLTYGARFDFYYLLPAPRVQKQFVNLEPIINPLPNGEKEYYLSPQAGVSFELFDGSTLHAAFGSGIRIPSIAERFMRFTIPLEFIGNPELRTEKSRSVEVGLRQRIGTPIRIEVTAFTNMFRNLIEPVYVAEFTRFFATLINIEKARIRGLEAALNIRLWRNHLRLDASTTWTDPVIIATGTHDGIALPFESGNLLSYRPALIAYLSPGITIGPLSLEADFAYTSKLKREQVQVFKDDERIAKRQLDLRASYRIGTLLLQLIVRNALQYNYMQIERNLGETRNFALALQWEG